MATGKGVIQGYTGVAAVDGAHQIIVEAQAHGTGSEHELLLPVVTAMQTLLTPESVITADAGYHSEANLRQLATLPGEALTVQAVLHHVRRAGPARKLSDWRGTAALPSELERGTAVGLHLALQGVDVAKPLLLIEWWVYTRRVHL